MFKNLMDRIGVIGILLEFVGILCLLIFQMFMCEIYTYKVTLTNKRMILMLMPENRSILWIGYFFVIVGFILIVKEEFKKK
ncbi:hypothetical protein HZA55_08630 [Candidatus Poribacteria bacterium]|nr:hypothetical protein [Candidatus Poribacteria bacterium]